jgi:hypothetical protein
MFLSLVNNEYIDDNRSVHLFRCQSMSSSARVRVGPLEAAAAAAGEGIVIEDANIEA